MAVPWGLAYFPGINQIVRGSISVTHGISPSCAQLTIAPQDNLNQDVGTLTFTDGSNTFNFPNAKVQTATFQRNSSGQIVGLTIYDRRWMWAYGQISGKYNVHLEPGWQNDMTKPDINLRDGTEKTPSELAKILLDEMNEDGYEIDISDQDDQLRPEVDWDRDPPAQCLANLCDHLGYRVVLRLDSTVLVTRVGNGQQLPEDGMIEDGQALDLKDAPDTLAIVCGPSLYQQDLELEAVGLETGGKWVPIDELSYTPDEGWINEPFAMMISDDATVQYAHLARYIYRAYRVKGPDTAYAVPPDDKSADDQNVDIVKWDQIGLQETQIDRTVESGIPKPRPAMVYGLWYGNGDGKVGAFLAKLQPPTLPPEDSTVDEDNSFYDPIIYKGGFSIDPAKGIVFFDDYVVLNKPDDSGGGTPKNKPDPDKLVWSPATLRLRTSFTVRMPTTFELDRYYRSKPTGLQNGTGDRAVKHDEIVMCYISRIVDDSMKVDHVDTNKTQIDNECDYYLAGLMNEYNRDFRRTIKYAGFRAIDLDGAIANITFEVGSGAITTASYNDEQLWRQPPYEERRRMERQRAFSAMYKRLASMWKGARDPK